MNFYGMDLPVNAAVAAPNPNFSIPTLLMTLGIMGPPGLLPQLLGVFYSFMKVTKKILQRNYLEKHLRLGLHTTFSSWSDIGDESG